MRLGDDDTVASVALVAKEQEIVDEETDEDPQQPLIGEIDA
jgi:hypothetical protein